MPRRLALLTAALITSVALATCAVVSSLHNGHLDIEQAELQARIAPRFPTHHCKLLIACVDLSNPLVVLTEGDDRIGLTADAKVTLGTRERTGRVGLSARPRYVPAEGQLFLDDLQVTTLELSGLPAEYAEVVKLYAPQLAKDVIVRPGPSLTATRFRCRRGAAASRSQLARSDRRNPAWRCAG
jgi:hypothetical protein